VTESGVYASYACVQAYSYAADTGRLLWHHDSSCSGGGGMTPAVFGNRIYAPDFAAQSLVLNPLTGEELGTFFGDTTPAGTARTAFILNDGHLTARPHDSTTPTWAVGDGTLSSAPLVVGAHVVIATTTKKITVLSAATGELVSSDLLDDAVTPGGDVGYVGAPLSGLAAANNHLFVPAGNFLYAF